MKITQLQVDMTREQIARHEFINWKMADVPTIYLALMPVTDKAVELLAAEAEIRRMVDDDFARVSAEKARYYWNPGPTPKMVKWDGVKGTDRCAMFLEPVVGEPGKVKGGQGIDPRDGQKKNYSHFIDRQELHESEAFKAANLKAKEDYERERAAELERLRSMPAEE